MNHHANFADITLVNNSDQTPYQILTKFYLINYDILRKPRFTHCYVQIAVFLDNSTFFQKSYSKTAYLAAAICFANFD